MRPGTFSIEPAFNRTNADDAALRLVGAGRLDNVGVMRTRASVLGPLLLACAAAACGGSQAGDDDVAPASAGGAGTAGSAAGAGPAGAGTGGTTAGATTGGAGGAAGAASGAAGGLAQLAFNQVRQKSSHNSYERQEAIFDQLVYHRLRSLEFDLHAARDNEPALAGDWYVYHFDLPGITPATSCTKFSDCLGELAAFHRAVPGHEVATIFVDLKSDFGAGHSPAELDALLASALPEGALFGPADLLAACPGAADLRAAVAGGACAWPSLEALRGKFVFALTGGDTCSPASKLSVYAGAEAGARAAFVAPEVGGACDVAALTQDRKTVFVNMKSGAASDESAPLVRAAGLVGRVYDLNDEGAWRRAFDAGAHVLATDKVNVREDPWADLSDGLAWPFGCFGGACAGAPAEAAPPVGVGVGSGDVDGASDSFFFVYDRPGAGPQAWSAYVSTENSHVEPFAKGCLMARGDAGPAAPYFAVCRPADENRIRVQFRDAEGQGTQIVAGVPLAPPGTVPHESWAFVKLELEPAAGGGVTATGWASRDGAAWTRVASHAFAAPLGLQGLAASGHGDPNPVTFYFGQIARSSGAESKTYAEADFATRAPVGGATGGSAQGYLAP